MSASGTKRTFWDPESQQGRNQVLVPDFTLTDRCSSDYFLNSNTTSRLVPFIPGEPSWPPLLSYCKSWVPNPPGPALPPFPPLLELSPLPPFHQFSPLPPAEPLPPASPLPPSAIWWTRWEVCNTFFFLICPRIFHRVENHHTKMLNVKTYLICCSSVSSRRTISAICVIDICVVAI